MTTSATTRPLALLLLATSALAPCVFVSTAARAATGDLIDPLASQTFTGKDASATAQYPGGNLSSATARQTSGTIAWDANAKKWTITAGGETASFAASDLDSVNSTPSLAVYARRSSSRTDTLTVTRGGTSGRFTYRYVRGAFWQRALTQGTGGTGRLDALVFGLPTASAAIPRTGTASYGVDFLGAGTSATGASGIVGAGTFDVSFADLKFALSGTMTRLYGCCQDVAFIAQGTLSSTGTFNAPLRVYSDATFAGALDGGFYGPAAEEVGGAWSLTQDSPQGANAMAGVFLGRRTGALTTPVKFASTPVNQFLSADGRTVRMTDTAKSTAPAAATVHYDAGTKIYQLIGAGRSFGPLRWQQTTYLSSRTPGGGSIGDGKGPTGDSLLDIHEGDVTPLGAQIPQLYVKGANWTRFDSLGVSADALLFGYATSDAAVPRTGGAGYDIHIDGIYGANGARNHVDGLLGRGMLVADFATGKLTLNGDFSVQPSFGSNMLTTIDTGQFKGTGLIDSTTNLLTGPIQFGLAKNGSFAGNFSGHFYGPGANEVGLAFSAKGGAGIMAGTLLGTRNAGVTSSFRSIAQSVGKTEFSGVNTVAYSGGFDSYHIDREVIWNPSTGDYTVRYGPASVLKFGEAQRDAGLTDSLYDGYRTTTPGYKWQVQVYRQGNSDIALTYASFGRAKSVHNPGTSNYDLLTWFYFGNRTPASGMPRSGTGRYTLALRGDGTKYVYSGAKTSTYALTGTGKMAVDFAAQTFTASGTLLGRDVATGADGTFANFGFKGAMGDTGFFGPKANNEYIAGGFFGPRANEIAGDFRLFRDNGTTRVTANGIVVGRSGS